MVWFMNKKFEFIEPAQAKELIDSQDITIVDVRSEDAYINGHIPDAILLNDDNREAFVKETDKGKPLICYCYKGFSSQMAANYLKEQGFTNVYSLSGGFDAFSEAFPEDVETN